MAKTRHRFSKHFVVEEFDCHDGTKVTPREYSGLEYLCRQYLEPMRKHFGPCSVHSGYRNGPSTVRNAYASARDTDDTSIRDRCTHAELPWCHHDNRTPQPQSAC